MPAGKKRSEAWDRLMYLKATEKSLFTNCIPEKLLLIKTCLT